MTICATASCCPSQLYHVFYQFNSVGVITNVLIPGIPALDAPLYVLYPWFMAALFMISGICARYSLEKQTGKQYLKGKVRRQLIPSIAIIFLIGWSTGWVTDQYANIFGGGQVPGFAKYLVWCMSGIGVLWFLHELLLCEVVLVLIRKLDKKTGCGSWVARRISPSSAFWCSACGAAPIS